jgi:hypothetical protein
MMNGQSAGKIKPKRLSDRRARECYEMAGEVRALVPDLEALVKRVLDAENGVE